MPQQCSRFKQSQSLEEQFAEEAKLLREEAKLLPLGAVREALSAKPNEQKPLGA